MLKVRKIRKLARERVASERGVLKFLLLWAIFAGLAAVVQHGWDAAVAQANIQTWAMFLAAKFRMLSTGLDLTVPSRVVARQMSIASAFEIFFNGVVGGIATYGFAAFFLEIARGGSREWFTKATIGFRRPLDAMWLYLRQMLQISLWSLLFVFPGIIAYYRYSLAWYFKSDHPEWSAGECLRKSAELMCGYKATRFALDLSYLLAFIGIAIIVSAIVAIQMPVLLFVPIWLAVHVTVRLSTAQAVFYLKLITMKPKKKEENNGTQNPTV